ncbi:hypothetical protein [Sphingomonas sp. R1]|uniref:hypothetical protein n=1 Tax=Sphingomonas sp. R1 TaxID=399176 RepID=UPI002225906F|nr:hypothetical protein [Sphingomonas sp. R1]UYY76518.1 hypothetical protein OIM94_13460 [Sphingomonas sp. R1]
MDLSSLQGLMVIVGPIVLAAVLLWAILRNKTSKRRLKETEDATRRNYEEHDAADRRR